ncbi:MAG: universal stress protein [Ignavibacteria bacterium]|nr:MAG: universal stress protein [Ignavibacteria bacterium]
MQQISKILVPVDFSDYSLKALKYATDFARSFDAKVYLIYVVEPVLYPADFSMGQIAIPDTSEDFVERGKNELNSLAEAHLMGLVEYETIVRTGRPFIEIIQAASEYDIDLIIIATHGHTGVEHLLFGSTAEKVVRKAPCPVLTIREPVKGFKYSSKDE